MANTQLIASLRLEIQKLVDEVKRRSPSTPGSNTIDPQLPTTQFAISNPRLMQNIERKISDIGSLSDSKVLPVAPDVNFFNDDDIAPFADSPFIPLQPSLHTIIDYVMDFRNPQTSYELALVDNNTSFDLKTLTFCSLYEMIISETIVLQVSNQPTRVSTILMLEENENKEAFNLNNNSSTASSTRSVDQEAANTASSIAILKTKPFWAPESSNYQIFDVWTGINTADWRIANEVISAATCEALVQTLLNCSISFTFQPPDPNYFLNKYRNNTIDPILLNAMLAWGARHDAVFHHKLLQGPPNQVGEPFFQKARALLQETDEKSSLEVALALVIMSVYQAGSSFEQKSNSSSYMYLMMAATMMSDLDLVDKLPQMDFLTRELHCRVFWLSIYVELSLATFSSRRIMSTAQDTFARVPEVSPLEYEDENNQAKVIYLKWRLRDMFIYRDMVFTLSSGNKSVQLPEIRDIENRINKWYEGIPSHLRVPSSQTARASLSGSTKWSELVPFMLELEYHSLLLQLYRSFLPNRFMPICNITKVAMQICLQSAQACIECLDVISRFKRHWCFFKTHPYAVALLTFQDLINHTDDRQAMAVAFRQIIRAVKIFSQLPIRNHWAVYMLCQSAIDFLKDKWDLMVENIGVSEASEYFSCVLLPGLSQKVIEF
ncbi:hypothetical protein K450DRAFT_229739 [Umbelopsis ramanniana AG]|uniref:Transcription factor domain-containing protein n=1 Tax=Umbelopsis ramanniana AG TaxID=1314678 RepID=A0AAD5EGL0_UMBRA|nr:uncharacterized protein K450DRAFT_229739 [Umbelopsis ramanniana AG]KAI8581890.1 hypothetical protein K450DRAFT_229739 [Umbelopsis ramanniana AG]